MLLALLNKNLIIVLRMCNQVFCRLIMYIFSLHNQVFHDAANPVWTNPSGTGPHRGKPYQRNLGLAASPATMHESRPVALPTVVSNSPPADISVFLLQGHHRERSIWMPMI